MGTSMIVGPQRRDRLEGRRLSLLAAVTLLLGGCVSVTPDGGMGPVAERVSRDISKEAIKVTTEAEAASARQRSASLLARPLSADSAVQVALLSNRGLQAEYNALGISEAAYVEASLPPSPTISFARIAGGGELEIERRLVANVLALITFPPAAASHRSEFEAARYKRCRRDLPPGSRDPPRLLPRCRLAPDRRLSGARAILGRCRRHAVAAARARRARLPSSTRLARPRSMPRSRASLPSARSRPTRA